MSDNLDKLFKSARAAKPDTARAEYGFETRLMARLRNERANEQPWYAFAWRLVPIFAAVVVLLGVWSRSAFRSLTVEAALGSSESQTFLGE
jgi:hypothetical protein